MKKLLRKLIRIRVFTEHTLCLCCMYAWDSFTEVSRAAVMLISSCFKFNQYQTGSQSRNFFAPAPTFLCIYIISSFASPKETGHCAICYACLHTSHTPAFILILLSDQEETDRKGNYFSIFCVVYVICYERYTVRGILHS